MKRPAFQFYPGDWQHDAALRSCSVAARGLWIEMMCIMHQGEPYGTLSLNGDAIDVGQLARMVGASAKETTRWLSELESAGAFSRNDDGRIYSRRMVRDERLRTSRAEGGPKGAQHGSKGALYGGLGGRPKGGNGVGLTGVTEPPLNPPPSSSSSSSPSSSESKAEAAARGTRLPKSWVLPEEWAQWTRQQRPQWAPAELAETATKFKNYWTAKTGKDATKLDWFATWQNWVFKERQQSGRNANPNRQESLEERNLRVAANWKPPDEDANTNSSPAATAAQPKE